MMYLSAAIALIGALGVFNLLISLALIRRLRSYGGTSRRAPGAVVAVTRAAGQSVGDFAVITTEERVISRQSIDQVTLVGFFSPGCPPCRERVPEFLKYASRFPGEVIAVAVGDAADPETGALAERLASGGTAGNVVVEQARGLMGSAFGVGGYPALCVVDPSGLIIASGSAIGDLPAPVPA
jgi:thiol-disulfide isomerase/thioredoxin